MNNGAFYLLIECTNCERETTTGPHITTTQLQEEGTIPLPTINLTYFEQLQYHCPHCGTTNRTGNINTHTEETQ